MHDTLHRVVGIRYTRLYDLSFLFGPYLDQTNDLVESRVLSYPLR